MDANRFPDHNTIAFAGLLKLIKSDIRSFYPKGNLFKCFIIAYFVPQLRLLIYYRIGRYRYLKRKKLSFFDSFMHYKMHKLGGNEISFKAEIGNNFRLAHPTGVIVGDFTVIGNSVTVFQQVTFGSHGKKSFDMSYPIISSNVIIYAGAKIIGNVKIGEKSVVGANSVVNIDVPADSIAVGIPCRIISKKV